MEDSVCLFCLEPHNKGEIDQLELVHHRAVRFATYWQRNTSSAGDMLQHLNWRSLKDRRIYARLVMMYKIENENIYLLLRKDRLEPPLRQSRNMHFSSFIITPCKTQQRQESFVFPRTISDWNWLSQPYSFESLGWNIQSCCLLFQVLIYEIFN